MPRAASSERTPLLPDSAGHSSDAAPCVAYEGEIPPLRRLAIALPYLLVFLAFEIAVSLVAIPMSPIQEVIICRKHYADVVGADPRCKNEVVQSELSMLKGWEVTFALIPGMVTAVPYGMAADKYGRRLVLGLSLLGLTLSQAADIIICRFPDIFPIHLIWLAASLTIIGGGPFVTIAMLFVIASDISTEAQRSTTFLNLSAISLVGQLIAAPLTYAAMAGGTWFSVYFGVGCLTVSTIATLFTTETYGMISSPETTVPESRENQSTSTGDNALRQVGPLAKFASSIRHSAELIRSIFWDNKKIGLLLSTFFFTSVGRNIPLILLQYITKRFQWTWAEAGLVNSISAAVNLATVGLILPFATQVLLARLGLSPLHKDLWLARAGIVTLVVGAFGIGLASSSPLLVIGLMIYSLGYGYGPAVRGVVVTMAEGRQTGLLFTSMSLLECLGLLVSGPLLAATFKLGMGWGGVWIGLPFITAGLCLLCAAVIVLGIRVDGSKASAEWA